MFVHMTGKNSTGCNCNFCGLLATLGDFVRVNNYHLWTLPRTCAHNRSAAKGKKLVWRLQNYKGLPSDPLPKNGNQIGRQGDHRWRACPPMLSRLIKVLKSTGRRRFAQRTVASF